MNRANKSAFDRIKTAGRDYQNAVKEALYRYRTAMSEAKEEAAKYKDEDSFMVGRKAAAVANAKNRILLAENAMKGTISAELDGLKDEVFQHLTTKPNGDFLATLKTYGDFNILPSHTEIQALLKLNGGNALGIRAVNAVLEKTNSKYRVQAPSGADFEKDLAALERLSRGGSMYSPIDYHTEMVEVYGNTPRLMFRDDGSSYDGGFTWDGVSLIAARANFEKSLKDLDGMADRWSKAVLPSAAQIKEYEPQTNESGKTVTAAEQFVEDYEATATDGATIEKTVM